MRSQLKSRLLRCWIVLTTVALVAACGGGSADDGDSPSESASTSTSTECGSAGFPCSLDQVAVDVLERGEQLADQVIARLDAGQTLAEVLDFLRAQADVADAAASSTVLRFRLNGGRDTLIFQPEALSPVTAKGPGTATASRPARESAQFVVNEGVATKRALVLAPFKYYFAPEDDGAAVAQLLGNTRGYGGNVRYFENAAKTAATVGLQQFIGWQGYDVIHVTSHGARVCDVHRCVSVILSGDIYSSAADLLRITETGVNTARLRGSDEKLLALGPEFFRKHYPAGLDRKIIFFNACQTYAAAGSGLSDVLLGQQSVFLGWTEVVQSKAAQDAALALFKNLSVNGVTVTAALDALGDLGFNRHTHDGEEVNSILLIDRDTSSDLRIREVVRLERPNGAGELFTNAIVNIVGKAQDGVPDHVPYQILVEGIPPEQQDKAIIQFTVNGHSSTPQAVTIGERVGETGWRLTGQIPYIDAMQEQIVEMRATVQLPEGGSSEHRVVVKLKAEVPAPPEIWIGEAVSHFDDSTPEGQVHITRIANVIFEQAPASVGGRYKVLRSTSGSMQWSRSGTIKTLFDGDCAYSSGTIDVPIAADDGEIIIDTAAASAYSMSGFTQGVAVRLAENCGSYAFSTRAGGAWAAALAQAEGFTVSADGAIISGATGSNQSTWAWTFRRQ